MVKITILSLKLTVVIITIIIVTIIIITIIIIIAWFCQLLVYR